jgi:hypothetical protein
MATCQCGAYVKFVPVRDRVQFDFGHWTFSTEYFNGADVISFCVRNENIHFTFQVDRRESTTAPRITTVNMTENGDLICRTDAHLAATALGGLLLNELPELADEAHAACFQSLLNGSAKAQEEEAALQEKLAQQELQFPKA